MRNLRKSDSWVVFMANHKGLGHGTAAVCEGDEWGAMELAQPGRYTLIQDEIANEGEAERLARSHSSSQSKAASEKSALVEGAVDSNNEES
jgi:hypothetical protein